MARRTIVAACLAGVAAAATALATRPPTSDCEPERTPRSDVHEFRAAEVVARPWFGLHHVYGIFILPTDYGGAKYDETLRVADYEEPFQRTRFPRPRRIDDVSASPGHYVRRSYVPTRIALWFLITGRFGDLRRACNWTLAFSARAPRAGTPAS
jgi:hypothetical protein